ncbi:hypothetical protein ACOMHN_058178 [Nucella lapillus]
MRRTQDRKRPTPPEQEVQVKRAETTRRSIKRPRGSGPGSTGYGGSGHGPGKRKLRELTPGTPARPPRDQHTLPLP